MTITTAAGLVGIIVFVSIVISCARQAMIDKPVRPLGVGSRWLLLNLGEVVVLRETSTYVEYQFADSMNGLPWQCNRGEFLRSIKPAGRG